MNTKKTLRSVLKKKDPFLYEAYMRSWEIAKTQWLPNIPQSMGSYNSQPHLDGVEYHLNDILFNKDAPKHIIELTAAEIYVLLSGVLLHDIGKGEIGYFAAAKEENDNTNLKADHAEYSEEIIKKHWAELGIVSEELANIIEPICRSHDIKNKAKPPELKDIYHIDRYGSIRGRKLSVLLILADKLDNTFWRVVPTYLHHETSQTRPVVGKFRSKIKSVQVDYVTKTVRTVIFKESFKSTDFVNDEAVKGKLYQYLSEGVKDDNVSKHRGTVFDIINDVASNHNELLKMQDNLYSMHITLNGWMIECDNHLFKVQQEKDGSCDTSFALEPIINCEYCCEVLYGILRLSGAALGKAMHSYEDLLRITKEDPAKLHKIICTVKRLSMLLKYNIEAYDAGNNTEKFTFDYKNSMDLYYDDVGWRIKELKISDLFKNDSLDKNGTWVSNKNVNKIYKILSKIIKDKVEGK